jgi:hypothetical protein
MIQKLLKNNLRLPIVIALCLIGLFLRLKVRAGKDIWKDERMQLAHMHGSFVDMMHTLPQREYFGYIEGDFYLIYPFFKLFGYNKWGLMLPHLVFTIIGFYVLYLIAQKYLKTTGAFIICFAVVAFNATLIQHALEIRYYAVFPTLVLVFFYLSDELWSVKFKAALMKKMLFSLFTVLLIWFHVYGLFAVGFLTLYFFFLHNKDEDFSLVKTLALFIPILCVALPLWIYCVFLNHLQYGTSYNVDNGTFYADQRNVYQFIPNPLISISGFMKGIFGNLMGQKFFYILYGILVLAWIVPHKERLKQVGFFLTLIILPIALLNYLDAKNGYWFVQRQFIWTMPLFALLLGWCWDSIVFYYGKK